jgi:hypothetical protein
MTRPVTPSLLAGLGPIAPPEKYDGWRIIQFY